MKVTVRITKSFAAAAKPLLKKYHSVSKDLLALENELILNPRLGTPLGHDAYKIRLKISNTGKGKSGGGRVITFVETNLIGITKKISNEELTVNLLTIYDKSEVDNISNKELKQLIKYINPDK